MKMRRGSSTVAEPLNAEQLRHRITLMETGLMMLGLKQTNCAFLQGMVPQNFTDYLSFLLGDFCYNLVGKDAQGHTVGAPTWPQLLVYELQIRKRAYRLIADGVGTFPVCLKQAWNDCVVKERFFTTPLAFSSHARAGPYGFPPVPSAPRDGSSWEATTVGKGKGRRAKAKAKTKATIATGGGKGKGAGKGSKGPPRTGCADKTPDGKGICYDYNDKDHNCSKGRACRFLHVCGRCFGDHPMFACNGNASRAETQGSGTGSQ